MTQADVNVIFAWEKTGNDPMEFSPGMPELEPVFIWLSQWGLLYEVIIDPLISLLGLSISMNSCFSSLVI